MTFQALFKGIKFIIEGRRIRPNLLGPLGGPRTNVVVQWVRKGVVSSNEIPQERD